jgi:hypothetical protein
MSFSPIPQRSITISINGTDNNASVTYTYWSPVYGTNYVNSPSCDLSCNQPTFCLYLLDFTTSQNGWTIVKSSPHQDSGSLNQVIGPNNLSLQTFNSYTALDTYRFYIHYYNMVTKARICFDPQEGNIPPV